MLEASLLSATGAVIEAIGAKAFAPALTQPLRRAVPYSYTSYAALLRKWSDGIHLVNPAW